jgi:hypothetical protein
MKCHGRIRQEPFSTGLRPVLDWTGSGSFGCGLRMRGAASLKITFKKTFNIPVNAAATQFFHGYAPVIEGKFYRTGVGIGPVTGDVG